jgi:hypothetical protein
MEKEVATTRVRANFTQTAKGIAQLDITAEAPTVKEMKDLLSEAFDAIMDVLKSKEVPVSHIVEKTKEVK